MLGAALGGKRQQGHPRLRFQEVAGVFRRLHGDVGQLRRRGVGEHPAVRVEQGAAHPELLPRQHHQEEARHGGPLLAQPHALQGGSHRLRRGVERPAHRAVRVARRHHQVGEVERLGGHGPGLLLGDAAGAAAL